MSPRGAQTIQTKARAIEPWIGEVTAGVNARLPDMRFRAPHILCLGFAGDALGGLIPALAREQVYVAARLGRMRVSPHVYNDEADVDRFVAAMARALKS